MNYTADISKNFVLNKAVRDATHILLRPYTSVLLTESCPTQIAYETKCDLTANINHKWISNSHDFLLKMARIAWDFLNVLNVSQNNIMSQALQDNDLEDEI